MDRDEYRLRYLPLPGDDFSGDLSESHAQAWFSEGLRVWLALFAAKLSETPSDDRPDVSNELALLAMDVETMTRAAWAALSEKRTVRALRDDDFGVLTEIASLLATEPREIGDGIYEEAYTALALELRRRLLAAEKRVAA